MSSRARTRSAPSCSSPSFATSPPPAPPPPPWPRTTPATTPSTGPSSARPAPPSRARRKRCEPRQAKISDAASANWTAAAGLTAACNSGRGLATDEFWLRERSTQHRESQPEVLSVRKVVVYELLSLDGVAEDPDSFFTDWDDVMDANLAAVIAAQDAVILGR